MKLFSNAVTGDFPHSIRFLSQAQLAKIRFQVSFPSCSWKWLQKMTKRSFIFRQKLNLWNTNGFPPAPLWLILWWFNYSIHSFLIWCGQNVSVAPYAVGWCEGMWTHYFSFDIISIQTCQPVQIGLQTLPSGAWDLSAAANERSL